MNRVAALALGLVVAVLAAACGASSTPSPSPAAAAASATAATTVEPTESATTSPASSPVAPTPTLALISPAPTATASATPAPPAAFRLASPAFAAGGAIPSAYTCDGADVSPALAWTGVPAGTTALVLLVTDPDASGFAHWIVTDIPPALAGLARGAGIAGASLHQGTNDFGRVGWGGPCPPSGTHRYRFTLYALAKPLGLAGHPGIATVRAALDAATVLKSVTLQATYTRH
jgi:Raf kinase inhibitor-like YbhB/YbcL family protein